MKRKVSAFLSVALFLVVVGIFIYFIPKNKADVIVVDGSSRPLPYLQHWSSTFSKQQIDLIDRGHHIIPGFVFDKPTGTNYNIKDILRARALNLPLTFNETQWESATFLKPPFSTIDTDGSGNFTGSSVMESSNPSVIGQDGKTTDYVDAFGPQSQIDLWRQLGADKANTKAMKFFQEVYPDPPDIYIAGNNEGSLLRASSADISKRYTDLHSASEAGMAYAEKINYRNRLVGDGFIERFSALFSGWRDDLNAYWKRNIKFVGFGAFQWSAFRLNDNNWNTGTSTITTYSNPTDLFAKYNDTVPRTSAFPYAWDGASPDYYLATFEHVTDWRVISPQLEAMNWVFMNEETRQRKSDFLFELSTWDGYEPSCDVATYCSSLANISQCCDKRAAFALTGYPWSPERYAGMVQYGMWLTRPYSVREFRNNLETWDSQKDYYYALMNAVDRVHRQPVLTDFWQNGNLVENPNGQHPYQAGSGVASGYLDADIKSRYGIGRWFFLNTDLDPTTFDTTTNAEIKVFSMALTKGSDGNREWLVYTHSPRQNRENVRITIPYYKDIVASNVNVGGNFYLIKENDDTITEIKDSMSALTNLIVTPENPIVLSGKTLQLAVAGKDQYDADITVDAPVWSATGGTISNTGLFTAGSESGDYEITVQIGSVSQKVSTKIDNLLAHWELNGENDTYVVDKSGRNNGCYSKSKWTIGGHFSGAALFDVGVSDGSNAISCDYDQFMANPDEFTISGWLNLNQGLKTGNYYIAGNPEGNLRAGYEIYYSYNGTGTGEFVFSVGDGTRSSVLWSSNSIPIEQNQWYHVVGEYKGGNFVKLFVNGNLIKSSTSNIVTSVGSNTQRFIIGSGVQGTVDDVRIYNQALDQTEILNLYNEVPVVAPAICEAPLTESQALTCPAGQNGSIIQARTKGDAPTCSWGDWINTSNTCTPLAPIDDSGNLDLLKNNFSVGWNMVSFPELSAGITNKSLLPDTFKIRKYDVGSNSYQKGETTSISFEPGMGYWLKIDDTNKITGINYAAVPTSSTERNVNKGWNLLGNPYQTNLPLSNLVVKYKDGSTKSYASAITSKDVAGYVWSWEASLTKYLFIAINPDKYRTSSTKQTFINPFRGFWIIIKSDKVSSIILNK